MGAADVYPSIGCGFFMEFIFLYDFLRNVTELYLGKFRSFEGCHEVEIDEINAHEAHTQCGNYTVEEYLDKEEHGRVGTHIFGIVDEGASHGCAAAIGFLLFIANRADKFDVGYIFEVVTGDFSYGYAFNGVGTLDASAYTLCKASKFIGSRNVPGVSEFGVTEELSVFQGLSGFHVGDSVGTVVASGKEASGNAVIVWVG
jgi:hypothetical protein